MRPVDPLPEGILDALVIGAGVVGCAIARRLALAGARVAILERGADILDGASKGNSAILHTGFDAPTGSLELACIRAGHAEYLAVHDRLGLPLDRAGALVIAWTEAEAAALPALMAQARANGVDDIEPLDARALREAEPALAPHARAAFRVPGESLIDPWSAPLAYLRQALAHGATLACGTPVTGGAFYGAFWRIETPRGALRARIVINAAGLHGDRVDALLLGRAGFEIRPRKGQFVVFDKPAAALARHILLPVPTEITKGVVVCRTVWGNLLVGPTAEEQTDRDRADLVPETLAVLRARGAEILPALAHHAVTASYAGLRPATGQKDYVITTEAGGSYVSVGGIRSTGLSAALGIAAHVAGLCAAPGWPAPAETRWPRVPNLAEGAPRDWQSPCHGGIVCHCEQVTRREILGALDGPAGARSLAGLKRRTRATMGRCQGFYCTADIARLTEGRLAQPMVGADG